MAIKFKISALELRAKKERNFEERLKFIDLWVDYIKKTPDNVWSAQQKELIDSQMKKK
ncbi:Uncharacterised protein [uncultured archaeon]|nr:Uncharacterised protein [uncultured archaeon]